MFFKVLRFIIFSSCTAVFILVLLEIGLTFVMGAAKTNFKLTESHPFLFYSTKPNLTVSSTGALSTNSLGLRYKELASIKPDKTVRIFLLGGSSAFGVGAQSDEETLSQQIERILNQYYPHFQIEVVNAAGMGFTSVQELIIYQILVCDYQPDMVLAFDGFNDAVFPIITGVPGFPERFAETKYIYNEAGTVKLGIKMIFKYSAWGSLIRNIKSKIASNKFEIADSINNDDFQKEIARQYERNLRNLCNLTNAKHIPLMLFEQPYLGNAEKKLSPEENRFFQKWTSELPERNKFVSENLELFDQALYNINRDLAVPVYNLKDVFKQTDQSIFLDACHVNGLGQRIEAEFIADKIIKHKYIDDIIIKRDN